MGVGSRRWGGVWNLWVWLVGVVVRKYIDFLVLLIHTRLVSVLFGSSISIFYLLFIKRFFVLAFVCYFCPIFNKVIADHLGIIVITIVFCVRYISEWLIVLLYWEFISMKPMDNQPYLFPL